MKGILEMMGEYYYRYKVTALSSCQQSVSGAMSRSISYGTFDLYKTKFRFFPYDALRWSGILQRARLLRQMDGGFPGIVFCSIQ